MNTVKVKIAKSKDQKQQDKQTKSCQSLSHSALGYQSLLKRLLAGISIEPNSVQLKRWIKFNFRI